MSIFGRIKALEKKVDDLENMVISLSQTIAELSEELEKQKKVTDNLPQTVGDLFNEAYNNAARELSAGIDQVLNFTPYGVK